MGMTRKRISSVKFNRAQYSESEAAKALGVTVDQLRALIREYIVEKEDDLKNLPRASFHASDLLVLRFLSAPPGNDGIYRQARIR